MLGQINEFIHLLAENFIQICCSVVLTFVFLFLSGVFLGLLWDFFEWLNNRR